jgi:hypothetical protein
MVAVQAIIETQKAIVVLLIMLVTLSIGMEIVFHARLQMFLV